MPPAKKTDTPKTTDQTAAADTGGSAPSYAEQAAALAADARALAEQTRGKLDELTSQVDQVQQTAPGVTEAQVADGVRRVPMAVGEVVRALEGLQATASDLQQRAAS